MRRLLILMGAAAALALPPHSSSQAASSSAAPQPDPARPCREERSVDEYLTEMNKAKKQRNKNPLPNSICIGGWCKGSGAGKPDPGQLPTSHPPQSPAPSQTAESSSKEGAEAAPALDPFLAAQSVEVGDYYFSTKKYRAALSRYQEALEAKPDDAAIYIRLARAFEKLDEPTRAFENYDASLTADPAGPFAEEARKAVERLRPEVEKRGDDAPAISERNRSRIVPRCRTAPPASPTPSGPPR